VIAFTSIDAPTITSSGTVTVNTANGNAVVAISSSTMATVVKGIASAPTGDGWGVLGDTASGDALARGVVGYAEAGSGSAQGVNGVSFSPRGLGVVGQGGSSTLSTTGQSFVGGFSIGTLGDSALVAGVGVAAAADDGYALVARNNSTTFPTAYFSNSGGAPFQTYGNTGSVRIDGAGNVFATGNFFGAAKDFRIDHPLDPSGKYLTKSRHRAGVLAMPGTPEEKPRLRLMPLINDAVAKNPKRPLVIFVDTNLPFKWAERVLARQAGNTISHPIQKPAG
jgi:hypothetical protein